MKPLKKQAIALACPAFELLYGGSKGGGKTHFLAMCVTEILQLAHRKYRDTGRPQRKCRIMVFRKNLDDLKDFLAKTFDIYPHLDQGAEYNKNEKTWTFTSGATVELRHLDGPTDHLGYNGNEFVAVLFDEVQFISYEAYSFLIAQVRSSDPDYNAVKMVRCTANPGGPHGDWVKRHFRIDTIPDGGKIFDVKVDMPDGSVKVVTRAFIRSRLSDNHYLGSDYEAQLRATMSADEVRMYLDGDFDVVAGSFFAGLIQPTKHFVKSFKIPDHWEMLHSTDWGSSAPTACYIGARDPEGTVHVIDEIYGPGVTGRTFGERLAKRFASQTWCKEKKFKVDDFWGVIDKQAFDNYGGESSAGAGIMEFGFRLFEAKKDRGDGINQMKERLLLGDNDRPRLIIFSDKCPRLVEAIKSIKSMAPVDPDDYDPRSPHAHACDALRFMLMEWPVVPVDEQEKELSYWERLIGMRRRKEPPTGSSSTGYGD